MLALAEELLLRLIHENPVHVDQDDLVRREGPFPQKLGLFERSVYGDGGDFVGRRCAAEKDQERENDYRGYNDFQSCRLRVQSSLLAWRGSVFAHIAGVL
jgi:hypothetical protein